MLAPLADHCWLTYTQKMLHRRIRRRIRKHTKAAARTFKSSTLGRALHRISGEGSKLRKRRHAKRCHCRTCTRSGAHRQPKKWIQKVTRRHPGALRRTVKTRYGRRGFDKRGRIKPEVLTKMSHEKGVTGKRARFAKQLRRMHK
jgi:hypothetical protein